MGFDKFAIRGLGTALDRPGAAISALEKAVASAQAIRNDVLAELKELNAQFKDAKKHCRRLDTEMSKLEATCKAAEKGKDAAAKEHPAAVKSLAGAESKSTAAKRTLSRAQANWASVSPQLAKDSANLLLAEKAVEGAQAEIKQLNDKIAAAEKALAKTGDNKRAVKEKAAAETALKKSTTGIKKAQGSLNTQQKSCKSTADMLKRVEKELSQAQTSATDADERLAAAQKQEQTAKTTLDGAIDAYGTAANGLEDGKATYVDAYDQVAVFSKQIPLKKKTLNDAEAHLADAQTELDNRLDKEEVLSGLLEQTAALLGQIKTELDKLQQVDPQAPAAAKLLVSLIAECKTLGSEQATVAGEKKKKALAAKECDLKDLAGALNALADDITKTSDKMDSLRDIYFSEEFENHRDNVIASRPSKFADKQDVLFPKTLKKVTDAAQSAGWTKAKIVAGQKTLSDKILEKIDRLNAEGEEKEKISGLVDDARFKNLQGVQIIVIELSRTQNATYSSVEKGLLKALKKQKKAGAAKWREFLSRKNIKEGVHQCGSTDGGAKLHVTLKGNFISPNADKINLVTDNEQAVMDKLFTLANAIFEIHATVEGGKWGNGVHRYYSGHVVGKGVTAAVKKAMKNALDDWLEANVATHIREVIKYDGNFYKC